MSHFAKINTNNKVIKIIVAEQDYIDTLDGNWVQCSYNTIGGVHRLGGTPFRKNYPGTGDTFDPVRDAFYVPKPYASYILNDSTCMWGPPIAYPDDDKAYDWDEDLYQSDNTKGWVEV
tara:strand:+ start:58 stop:411 length:354 start_codon:yes stop_codon:yes gene_type:complete